MGGAADALGGEETPIPCDFSGEASMKRPSGGEEDDEASRAFWRLGCGGDGLCGGDEFCGDEDGFFSNASHAATPPLPLAFASLETMGVSAPPEVDNDDCEQVDVAETVESGDAAAGGATSIAVETLVASKGSVSVITVASEAAPLPPLAADAACLADWRDFIRRRGESFRAHDLRCTTGLPCFGGCEEDGCRGDALRGGCGDGCRFGFRGPSAGVGSNGTDAWGCSAMLAAAAAICCSCRDATLEAVEVLSRVAATSAAVEAVVAALASFAAVAAAITGA